MQDAGLTLNWKSVTNASTYTVYYQLGETISTASARSIQTKQTSIILENLSNYSSYIFAVMASNILGSSELSASLQERIGIRLSRAPEDLTATLSEAIPNTIQLSWSPLAQATTYRIHYQLADDPKITTDTSTNQISLTDLVADRIYSFQVQGINPVSVSALSAIIQEGAFSKSALTITLIQGQQTLEFSWDEADDVDYYRLLSDLGTGWGL